MSSSENTIIWTKYIAGFIDDNRQYINDRNLNNNVVLPENIELSAQVW